jgi:hypothetical protein
MNMHVFRVPDYAAAHLAAYVLGSEGVAAHAGVRHHLPYVSVRSDRDDIESLVRGLIPAAVPVNLEHLPLPLPDEVALFS